MAKNDSTTKSDDVAEKAATAAQEAMDAEQERGFRGVAVDPTPNENYTVSGVLAGKPTPETDPEHRRAVRAEIEDRQAGQA